MSYLDWHVGMKVVCTKRGKWTLRTPDAYQGCKHPFHGGIYTIREVGVSEAGEVYIRLSEIINSVSQQTGRELAFTAHRFRPAQTRKTDISIFTAMLDRVPSQKEQA